MYPFYPFNQLPSTIKLNGDDITRIKQLYGIRPGKNNIFPFFPFFFWGEGERVKFPVPKYMR